MPEVRLEIPRSPRFYPVELPSAPSFHPELGYLLPSPSLQRKLRGAAVVAFVGLAIAASTALALMPQRELQPATHEEPLVAALPQPAPIEEAAPAVLVPRPALVPVRAQGVCDDLSNAFLAPECRAGRTGKGKAGRAAHAGRRLDTVTIGRANAEPEPRAAGPAQAAPSTVGQADPAAKPAEPAVTPKPKAPAKVARRPERRPGFDAATADPGASRNNSGGVVLPSWFGGEWARSW